jgi:hypothetical protein
MEKDKRAALVKREGHKEAVRKGKKP